MKLPQWAIIRKFDLTRTEDKLKLGILTIGILLFLLIGAGGVLKLTMAPSFCAKCHVMTPEYVTWEASSHVQIPCTSCHIKPGLGNLIAHKLAASKELLLYFTNTYNRPIKMSHKLPDVVCTQCHSTYRSFTPSGDLIIPHDKHADKKVLCVECHKGVAHGNIVARGMTKDDNYSAWTPEVGKKQMVKDYAEPKMNDCLGCHIKRNVTQACEACHTSISLPADHKVKTWDKNHGAVAKTDLGYCNKCHSFSLEVKDVPGQTKVASYARGNVFCYDCHQKRPKGHTADWKITHPADARSDIPGCLVCHNKTKPKPAEKSTPTYCDKCHSTGGEPSPGLNAGANNGKTNTSISTGETFKFEKAHQPGWRKEHPNFIKTQGIVRGKCFSCHDTSNCSYCHTKSSAAQAKTGAKQTVTNAGYTP